MSNVNFIVRDIRYACKFEPSSDLLQVLEWFRIQLSESDLKLKGHRCSFLLVYLLEALLLVLGRQFTLSPKTARAKALLVAVVETLLSKISEKSHSLTNQLIAILAQSVFSFRGVDPVDKSETSLQLFSRLASIDLSRKLLRVNVFVDLFMICTLDYLQCLIDIIFHYCCAYDTSRRKSAHATILHCLAVYGDQFLLEHFYLQDW
ncbi:CIC11C00000002779 [Sungouiella intermedia]|uniref:CIC11C00000002779 n=1 Tax=Sungouiella intermedia TaxID=45354 RepID=A0A1L0DNH4_9ASCO|nr:CIC11C00000002779 [[Candida] intermedia]